MKTHQKSGIGLICLALLIAIATIAIAGSVDSGQARHGQIAPTSSHQSEQLSVGTAATTRITITQTLLKTTQTTPILVLSNAVITFDPIGDKFFINGTTSFPSGTNLFWEIIPDTGTPPTGVDINAQRGIMANNLVTKGDTT